MHFEQKNNLLISETGPTQWSIINTRLGIAHIHSDNIYTFEKPLLGFEEEKRFGLGLMPGMPENTPFMIMQSLDDENLCFILLNNTLNCVEHVEQTKSLLLEPDVTFIAAILDIPRDELTYAMIVSKNNAMKNKISINTMAPIFFHHQTGRAWQIVLTNPIYNTCEPFV
ncbi:MAG: flagellar assembly protein FliW [Alphaproteobacteria bacterium]|nr:flagellar assembly protein FliW [Alphaproteobacteria bacterium]